MVAVFNLDNLINHLRAARENLDDIHFYHFSEAMLEYSNSFSFLGRALSMAFSDITTKAQIIQTNFKNSSFTGLQSMIRDEVMKGTEKEHSSKKASTARTVLRLMWFLDFLKVMITHLIEHRDWTLEKACRKAYKTALAPHHPWAVRVAAKLGIKTVPSKESYMSRLLGNIDYDRQIEVFQVMMNESIPIREALWKFYNDHNLTNLP